MSECKLLGGPLTYVLQLSLGLCALSILYVKWKREYPQRELKVFSFDVSKQVVGMGFAHLLNMAVAVHLANGDQCRWYFINFFVDVTLGTICNYGFIQLSKYIAYKKNWRHLDMGNYQHSTRKINRSYIMQLGLWLGIIATTKLLIYSIILIPSHSRLDDFGKWVLHPVSTNSTAELAVVMVVFPVLFNIFQFWVQDTFLKGDCHYIEKPYTITEQYTEM